MQVLAGAGFDVLGEAFPARWERSIQDANPRGFWESRLRKGIYFETNPDPETGAYLHPERTQRTVVKVFSQGLIRTDWAFLKRVVVSMRPWRVVSASMRDLYRREEEFLGTTPKRPAIGLADEWWIDNYEILRDAAVRGYPFRLVACERMVEAPRETLQQLLPWLGGGDLEAAVAAVAPELQRSAPADEEPWPLAELADAWYQSVLETGRVPPELVHELNEAHQALEERLTS